MSGVNAMNDNIKAYDNREISVTAKAQEVNAVAKEPIDIKAGETFTGKVVANDNGNVTLNVNGNLMQAKIAGNMDLTEGQTVSFTMRNLSQQQITISPLFTNLSSQEMAAKALNNANLPVTPDTLQLASAMMEKGLSIDKESLGDMVRASNNFPMEDLGKLSEMQRYGLDINNVNIDKFDAFKNYENQISDGIKNIINEIPNAYNNLINNGQVQEGMELLGSVIKTFTAGADSSGASSISVNPNEVNAETMQVTGNPTKTMDSSDVQGMGLNGESLIREKQVISEERILLKGEDITPNVENLVTEAKDQSIARNEIFEASVRVPGQETEKVNIDLGTKVADAWQTLDNTDKSAFVDVLKQSGLGENEAKFLLSDASTQADFLKATGDLINSGMEISDSLKDMIQSDKFGNVMKSQLAAQMLLSPVDVGDKETVESLYDRLNEHTKELTEVIKELGITEGPLSQNLSDMNQNMDFMQQMNQMAQYIQLPLKMNGSEATGDLYVYTDKKHLAEHSGSVSALLHLDMKNLGPMDVYASITPGNSVHTKFYLASDEIIDLINDNIDILNQRLEARGYAMKSEITNRDSLSKRPSEEEVVEAAPSKPQIPAGNKIISKMSFDCFA